MYDGERVDDDDDESSCFSETIDNELENQNYHNANKQELNGD